MLSYQVIEHGKPLQKVFTATPKPKGTEVLVRITRSGVCHSDLHIWDGYFDLGGGKRFYVKDRGCVPPFTLGHEPFGVVEAFGAGAAKALRGLKVGQRRLVYPWIGCGKCAVCKAGQDNYCVSGTRFLGINRAGGYSTHVLIPHPKYLVDTAGVDDAFAATLACSGRNDYVAVLGCGGLGLVAISILKALGIRNVIACDVDAGKLAVAKKLGAALVLDTRGADAAQRLGALAKGNLAGAMDYVGMPATFMAAYPALRKGGRYILCGLFGGEVTLPLPPIAQRAVGVIGSYVGNLAELKAVVALAKKKKLKPMPVETRAAAEVNRTLDELKAGKILGRVVLDFETAKT